MQQRRALYNNNKKNIYAFLILIGSLAINRFVLGVFFEHYMTHFMFLNLLANIIVGAYLSNSAYYTSKVNVNQKFIYISFLSFLYVFNLLIGIVFLFNKKTVDLEILSYFITSGKMLFLMGLLIVFILKKDVLLKLVNLKNAVIAVFLMVIIESVAYFIFYSVLNELTRFNAILNVFYLFAIMIFLLEITLTVPNDSIAWSKQLSTLPLFSFALIFVSQFVQVILSSSFLVFIQSNTIFLVAMLILFWEINDNNIKIPEEKNRELQKQFNIYSKYLKKIIDKKTLQVREVNQKIIDELEYAKIIQQSLLPSNKITHRDVSFTSAYYPCERLSGDFYDIYSIDDDNVALYLLDVSGHGISAALMTMLSNNYLKSNERVIKRFRGMHPDKNLKYFYEQFNRMNFPDEMHMVIFYATLDLNTKILTYCSGGMNCNPIRFKANGKVETLDQSSGFPICKLDGLFTPEYTSEKIQLERGDRILFYTDGLTDKEKNEIFDTQEIMDLFVKNKNLTSREINDIIVEKINAKSSDLNDDITYIIMDI